MVVTLLFMLNASHNSRNIQDVPDQHIHSDQDQHSHDIPAQHSHSDQDHSHRCCTVWQGLLQPRAFHSSEHSRDHGDHNHSQDAQHSHSDPVQHSHSVRDHHTRRHHKEGLGQPQVQHQPHACHKSDYIQARADHTRHHNV